jgi:magnesium transporter
MLRIYENNGRLTTLPESAEIPPQAIWIDLFEPTQAEERSVEQLLSAEVPTREEMAEIEVSSRLYEEDGILYMTASVLHGVADAAPQASPVTFILSKERLVTIRYVEPTSFRNFGHQCEKERVHFPDAESVLVGLLEAIVDRTADVLEQIGPAMDRLSDLVFTHGSRAPKDDPDFREVMQSIGRSGDLNSKIRECLVSTGRVTNYLASQTSARNHPTLPARMESITGDLRSLTDYSGFVAGKIAFMLDATLGFINIQQNTIIKIVSIVSVVIMPPTMVASIYGMNFQHMPELGWRLGYPMALGFMLASAVIPFLIFKAKRWF